MGRTVVIKNRNPMKDNKMENINTEIREQKIEEVIKITVTAEAAKSLAEILAKVNDGFDAGKVTRQDLASWIIEKFKKSFSDSDVQLIRKDFFSEQHFLKSILSKAKTSSDIPDVLRKALKAHCGIGPLPATTPAVPRRPAKVPSPQSTPHQNGVENGKTNL